MPDQGTAQAKVGLVFDYASAWAWETQPQGRDFDYFRLAFAQYRALRRLGLNVDILPPDVEDISAYKLVLAPGVATLSDALLGALAARAGGARMGLGAWRVGFWGALAMAITAGVGALFGAVV